MKTVCQRIQDPGGRGFLKRKHIVFHNPVHAIESARREEVQGEGGFWERELTTQRLPLVGFFGYFLAETRKFRPPAGAGTIDLVERVI
jgi:hypothetical protein